MRLDFVVSGRPKSLPLKDGQTLIGRAGDCDIPLTNESGEVDPGNA